MCSVRTSVSKPQQQEKVLASCMRHSRLAVSIGNFRIIFAVADELLFSRAHEFSSLMISTDCMARARAWPARAPGLRALLMNLSLA
jgi:hypothetical protein